MDPSRSSVDLAIDLGGTRVRTAVFGEDRRLVGRIEEPSRLEGGPRSTVNQIVRMGRESLVAASVALDRLRSVVASAPGPLDSRLGVVFDPPNLPGWQDVPLERWLVEGFGVRARIVNDANAAAVGEHAAGAGRGTSTMVYLTISTGIGGGVIVDGRLMEGASGTAGELGHMTVDLHGPRCPCGNVGCLEVLASGTAIAHRFRGLVRQGRSTRLSGPDASAAQIAEAAASGDALASEVFLDAAQTIGIGVVNCVHIFNPELVVLGGGVAHAGELLFAPVRRIVAERAMKVPRDAVRVERAELGDDAGLVGAAVFAQQEFSRGSIT